MIKYGDKLNPFLQMETLSIRVRYPKQEEVQEEYNSYDYAYYQEEGTPDSTELLSSAAAGKRKDISAA